MSYNGKTKLGDILSDHPWLQQELPKMDPMFEKLKNPAAMMVAKRMTLQDASKVSGMSVDSILKELDTVIVNHNKTSR